MIDRRGWKERSNQRRRRKAWAGANSTTAASLSSSSSPIIIQDDTIKQVNANRRPRTHPPPSRRGPVPLETAQPTLNHRRDPSRLRDNSPQHVLTTTRRCSFTAFLHRQVSRPHLSRLVSHSRQRNSVVAPAAGAASSSSILTHRVYQESDPISNTVQHGPRLHPHPGFGRPIVRDSRPRHHQQPFSLPARSRRRPDDPPELHLPRSAHPARPP